MKKTLIIILIIVILGGLVYFAYSKGLISLDFLKKGSAVVEPVTRVDNNKEVKNVEPMTVPQIDEYVKSVNEIKDYDVKNLDDGKISNRRETNTKGATVRAYIKNGNIYRISENIYNDIDYIDRYIIYYVKNNQLVYINTVSHNTQYKSWADHTSELRYYFNNGVPIKWEIVQEDKDIPKDEIEDLFFRHEDYIKKFEKVELYPRSEINNITLDKVIGVYWMYRNSPHQIILKKDGTFVIYESPEYGVRGQTKTRGKFFVNGLEMRFVYDDKRPDSTHELISSEYKNIPHIQYIDGEFDFMYEEGGPICEEFIDEIVYSSNLSDKSELYKSTESYKIDNLIDRIENNIIYINVRLDGETDRKTGEILSNGGTIKWLTFDINKNILTMLPPNEDEEGTVLNFDKDIINEVRMFCKK